MLELIETSRIMAFGLSFVMVLQFARYFTKSFTARVATLFCFGCCCDLLRYFMYSYWSLPAGHILSYFTGLVPVGAWLLAFAQFEDDSRLHRGFWFFAVAFFALRALRYGLYIVTPESYSALSPDVHFLLVSTPNLILLGFVFHSVYIAVRGIRVDLIEVRRRIRMFYSLVISVILVVYNFADIVLDIKPSTGTGSELYRSSGYLFLFVVFHYFLFKLSPSSLKMDTDRKKLVPTQSKTAVDSENEAADKKIVDRLEFFMVEESIYRQAGLSIGILAKKMGIAEYRLRRLINGRLGYSNFNQYMNKYRIDQAQVLLNSTQEPIVNIALDLGYKSLSTFNRAFRASLQMTPSEYRVNVNNTS